MVQSVPTSLTGGITFRGCYIYIYIPEDARGAAPPRTPQGNVFFTVEVGFQASPGPTQCCAKGKDLIRIPKHPHYVPLASVVDASAVLRRRGLITGKPSRCRCCH